MSDLIKREDAIKALRLEYPMMPLFKAMREEWALRTEGFRRAEEVIMRLPSAERKGEWIRTGRTNIYGGIEVQCSNCGDKVMVQHLEDEWYCRHCGADMGVKGADDERQTKDGR